MDPDEYPCDDSLFALVDADTNAISVSIREITACFISQAPVIEVDPATSQRLAGISRRLTQPDTLPYSPPHIPHTIFTLYVPPEDFCFPMDLLSQKRTHLDLLYTHSISTANLPTNSKPFCVHTLLPPQSQLRGDNELANHQTHDYMRAWPAAVSFNAWYTATGLAENLAAQS
jgi:hypothetical protein